MNRVETILSDVLAELSVVTVRMASMESRMAYMENQLTALNHRLPGTSLQIEFPEHQAPESKQPRVDIPTPVAAAGDHGGQFSAVTGQYLLGSEHKTNDCTNDRTNDRTNDHTNDLTNGRPNESTNGKKKQRPHPPSPFGLSPDDDLGIRDCDDDPDDCDPALYLDDPALYSGRNEALDSRPLSSAGRERASRSRPKSAHIQPGVYTGSVPANLRTFETEENVRRFVNTSTVGKGDLRRDENLEDFAVDVTDGHVPKIGAAGGTAGGMKTKKGDNASSTTGTGDKKARPRTASARIPVRTRLVEDYTPPSDASIAAVALAKDRRDSAKLARQREILKKKVLIASSKRPLYRHIVSAGNRTLDAAADGGEGSEVYYRLDREKGKKKPARLKSYRLEAYGSMN